MAFGSFDKGSSAPMAEINTTPLVDVMLVLLVVFIVTAPLFTHAVPINLPRENAAQHQDKPEAVNLAIDSRGKLFWNDRAQDPAGLETRLSAAARGNPRLEVHVRADKNARYEDVAGVMAAAQRSGIERLGFVTEAAGR